MPATGSLSHAGLCTYRFRNALRCGPLGHTLTTSSVLARGTSAWANESNEGRPEGVRVTLREGSLIATVRPGVKRDGVRDGRAEHNNSKVPFRPCQLAGPDL